VIKAAPLITALLPSAGFEPFCRCQGRCPTDVEQCSIEGWVAQPIQSEGKEDGMKSRLFQGMLTAAIALPALSGAALAGGTDDYGCSNATLQGEYAFGGTNYTSLEVFNGIKVFDGNGKLKQRDYLGSTAPPEFAPPGQETGAYTVNSDCTGSMVITTSSLVVNVLFVISDGGRHIHEVVSQLTPAGAPGPAPAQTSADDWKVASEQHH
jgi:hypothetical protein